ncbi:MAG TPA: Rieske 2Fe-2S domain-containing protein [Chloroflexota bacterium]|jgi:nitrite reductase/ring-hydroxylating ferredoxin subunit
MPPAEFEPVVKLGDLPDGEAYGIQIGGDLAVLVRCGDRVYALGGHCPHTGMRLADGVVAEGRLICYYHGANFDLETGQNLPQRLRGGRFDTRDLPRYAVRVEGDTVYVATTPANPEVLSLD